MSLIRRLDTVVRKGIVPPQSVPNLRVWSAR